MQRLVKRRQTTCLETAVNFFYFRGVGAMLMFGVISSLPAASIFTPGNLVVSRSVYTGTSSTVTVGQALPPNCPSTASCPTKTATNDGTYPTVFNNDLADGSFGVTSPIYLDQLTTAGTLLNTFAVPTNQLVTSFSSKSEIALNVAQDGQSLTFMGYAAAVNTLDVSNSNTPGVYDPTNPVGNSYYRVVAQLTPDGTLQTTDVNPYSGNNGRAAAFAAGNYYLVGNSNNGGGTPANVVAAAGAQIATPGQSASQPPTEIGNFSVTQYGYPADKAGKDNNFRGLRLYGQTMYVTKGSGSNGIDTVYQVGSSGSLPTTANASSEPITVLNGFPTSLARSAGINNIYPFGIWFANASTMYVADEGDGTYADAARSTYAGLQKWVLTNGAWTLQYVLQSGLNLGQPYAVPANPNFPGATYPTGTNSATNLNWAPETDGLRNLTGRVNGDGTVTLWAVTSTVSGSGDQGADPNMLVSITDTIASTTAAGESFAVVDQARYGEVLRGVSFVPVADVPLQVEASGLLYSRATRMFTGSVTVTNNTSSPVAGPLMLVLTGLTQNATVPGNPEIVFDAPAIPFLTSGSLGVGQSTTVPVQFNNPTMGYINYTPVVFPRF